MLGRPTSNTNQSRFKSQAQDSQHVNDDMAIREAENFELDHEVSKGWFAFCEQ